MLKQKKIDLTKIKPGEVYFSVTNKPDGPFVKQYLIKTVNLHAHYILAECDNSQVKLYLYQIEDLLTKDEADQKIKEYLNYGPSKKPTFLKTDTYCYKCKAIIIYKDAKRCLRCGGYFCPECQSCFCDK